MLRCAGAERPPAAMVESAAALEEADGLHRAGFWSLGQSRADPSPAGSLELADSQGLGFGAIWLKTSSL